MDGFCWTLVKIIVLPYLNGTQWMIFVYRCFGAQIGDGVFIEEPCLRVPDLVCIGSNSYISSQVSLRCVREKPEYVVVEAACIGEYNSVQSRSFLDMNTVVGDRVEISPLVHVVAGKRVPSRFKIVGMLS